MLVLIVAIVIALVVFSLIRSLIAPVLIFIAVVSLYGMLMDGFSMHRLIEPNFGYGYTQRADGKYVPTNEAEAHPQSQQDRAATR